jgi:hypothetical protein
MTQMRKLIDVNQEILGSPESVNSVVVGGSNIGALWIRVEKTSPPPEADDTTATIRGA